MFLIVARSSSSCVDCDLQKVVSGVFGCDLYYLNHPAAVGRPAVACLLKLGTDLVISGLFNVVAEISGLSALALSSALGANLIP